MSRETTLFDDLAKMSAQRNRRMILSRIAFLEKRSVNMNIDPWLRSMEYDRLVIARQSLEDTE